MNAQGGEVKCTCDPDKGVLDQPFDGGYCAKFYYFRPGRQVTLYMDVSEGILACIHTYIYNIHTYIHTYYFRPGRQVTLYMDMSEGIHIYTHTCILLYACIHTTFCPVPK